LAIEKYYDNTNNERGTIEAILAHYNEGIPKEQSGPKKTSIELYRELFTTYGWNIFIGIMLHIIQ